MKFLVIITMTIFIMSCSQLKPKTDRNLSSVNLKLCINSSVYSGLGDVINNNENYRQDFNNFEKIGVKVFGDFVLGHASIEIKKDDTTMRSYGYFPDDNLILNEDHSTGKNKNSSIIAGTKVVEYHAGECYPITFSQVETIENLANDYINLFGDWTEINNCVRFAQFVYTKVTGKKLNTLLPLPISLYEKISSKQNVN